MEMLQEVWKQHLRPRAVVGYGLKIFLPSPPNYVTRSPGGQAHLKDGAYYCYCAYVLRISRYSDFLSPMLTNTGIFLRGLKLSGESRS